MTRIYVREETKKTQPRVKYDGKALNDAVGNLIAYPLVLAVLSFGVLVGSLFSLRTYWWLAIIAGILMVAFGANFFKYLDLWSSDPEVTQQMRLYVELPGVRRGR